MLAEIFEDEHCLGIKVVAQTAEEQAKIDLIRKQCQESHSRIDVYHSQPPTDLVFLTYK